MTIDFTNTPGRFRQRKKSNGSPTDLQKACKNWAGKTSRKEAGTARLEGWNREIGIMERWEWEQHLN